MSALAQLEAGWPAERLVPGGIAALEVLRDQVAATADHLVDLARGIGYIELTGADWSGHAATVYAAAKQVDVASFKAAASVFDDATEALAGYLSVLKDARHSAGAAVEAYASGRKQRDDDIASCTPPPPPVSPTVPYDPYGLQAAADLVEDARQKVASAAAVAAPLLRMLASAAPGFATLLAPDEGHELHEILTAPWHLAHGAYEILGNALIGLGYAGTPLEGVYADRIDAGADEAGPALATLGGLALLVAGARSGAGELPIAEEPATIPRFSNRAPEDPIMPGKLVPLDKLRSMTGTFQYVVGEDGRLLIGRGGHIDLSRGSDVLAAGEVKIVQGEVRMFNNASGHFRPDASVELIARTAISQQTDLVIRSDAWKAVEH